MKDREFEQNLKKAMQGRFIQFDTFIMGKMGYGDGMIDKDSRYDAFHEFRKRTKRRKIATMPTMRRWFGIGEYHKPRREHVIEMCFAMELDADEAAEYLTCGMAEPSFMVNDYQEIIFFYGLIHHLTYETCLKMIVLFEKGLQENMSFSHTKSTKELMTSFEANKKLEKEEFLLWMFDRAEWFRGYSKTTMDYLEHFRCSIQENVRKEAKERLNPLLHEAGYPIWKKKHAPKLNEAEAIRRFVKRGWKRGKKYHVSENMGKNILELVQIAFSARDTNTCIISEIYGNSRTESCQEGSAAGFRRRTGKYMSDLFHIPEKKEQTIKISQALRAMENMPEESACPEWIYQLGQKYLHEKEGFTSVAQAKKELGEWQRKEKRRCLSISRSDLLPLILYISQKQYEEENKGVYVQEEARAHFRNLADAIMNACNMDVIHEKYQLDMALLQCYQPEEMYSYQELLEFLPF